MRIRNRQFKTRIVVTKEKIEVEFKGTYDDFANIMKNVTWKVT